MTTEEYLPGVEADLRLPLERGPAPLVVLVPGGGWQTADRTGLEPLADTLTASGATTATITYRTASDGVLFPVPADDVACAVRWAVERATQEGRPPTHTIVAGHSAGGHLAALTALSGAEFGADCPAPPVPIDGFVGIAGVYDLEPMESALTPLFGASRLEQPDAWERGSPITWAARAGLTPPGFRTLLIHGATDELVPVEQSLSLAKTLTERRVDTLVELVADATHQNVYHADIAAPLIQKWLDSWT
jgi:acetyl esterase/lipase